MPRKLKKQLIEHGDIRIDPYYWMNDRENPEVIDYLNQENEYTKTVLKPTEGLQKQLFDEIKRKSKKMMKAYLINSMVIGTKSAL